MIFCASRCTFETSLEQVFTHRQVHIMTVVEIPWVIDDEIEVWAYANTTGVTKTIKEALIELEHDGKVSIKRQPGQRKNTVVSGARIRADK